MQFAVAFHFIWSKIEAPETKGGNPVSDCLFCKIIKGDIPSNKGYEDELCLACCDIDPQAPAFWSFPRPTSPAWPR